MKITNNVKTVTNGYECTFVIKNDNSLWGIGKRLPGLLDQKETDFQLSPKKIMDKVATIAVNDGMEPVERGALILKTDGSLWVSG